MQTSGKTSLLDSSRVQPKVHENLQIFMKIAVAGTGEKTLAIFERYGNFTQLGYTEEYAKAQNLLQDIEALGPDALTAANFTPWYEALTLKHA